MKYRLLIALALCTTFVSATKLLHAEPLFTLFKEPPIVSGSPDIDIETLVVRSGGVNYDCVELANAYHRYAWRSKLDRRFVGAVWFKGESNTAYIMSYLPNSYSAGETGTVLVDRIDVAKIRAVQKQIPPSTYYTEVSRKISSIDGAYAQMKRSSPGYGLEMFYNFVESDRVQPLSRFVEKFKETSPPYLISSCSAPKRPGIKPYRNNTRPQASDYSLPSDISFPIFVTSNQLMLDRSDEVFKFEDDSIKLYWPARRNSDNFGVYPVGKYPDCHANTQISAYVKRATTLKLSPATLWTEFAPLFRKLVVKHCAKNSEQMLELENEYSPFHVTFFFDGFWISDYEPVLGKVKDGWSSAPRIAKGRFHFNRADLVNGQFVGMRQPDGSQVQFTRDNFFTEFFMRTEGFADPEFPTFSFMDALRYSLDYGRAQAEEYAKKARLPAYTPAEPKIDYKCDHDDFYKPLYC